MDVKAIFLFTTFLSVVGGVISFIFSKLQLPPLLGGLKGALSSTMSSGGGLGRFVKNNKSAPGSGKTTPRHGRLKRQPQMQPKGRFGGGSKLGGRRKWGRGLFKIFV